MDSLGRNVDVFFTPYFNSDVFKGQHPGSVLNQKPEGVKLLGRQVDLLALNRDQPLLRADIEIPNLDGGRGSRGAGCRRLDSGKAREASRRFGLFCYVKAEIQEVTLLLRIQQIQQALPNLTARGIQVEYRYFPMSPPPSHYFRNRCQL
jgi:hypothetical protein